MTIKKHRHGPREGARLPGNTLTVVLAKAGTSENGKYNQLVRRVRGPRLREDDGHKGPFDVAGFKFEGPLLANLMPIRRPSKFPGQQRSVMVISNAC